MPSVTVLGAIGVLDALRLVPCASHSVSGNPPMPFFFCFLLAVPCPYFTTDRLKLDSVAGASCAACVSCTCLPATYAADVACVAMSHFQMVTSMQM